jgi:hypothetical protein
MKQKLLCGLMALVLGPAALSQTSALYENWGVVQCPPEVPPMIDASNFVNHASFLINFTNGNLLTLPVTTKPFETTSTLNYTNDFGALMSCNAGFRMETFPQSGARQRASSLYNNGTIDCGTVGTSNLIIIGGFLFNLVGSGAGVKCQVDATNIYNPGTINMGFDSLLSLKAENLDLSHGTLTMESSGFNGNGTIGTVFFNGGFFDGYWGLGIPNTNIYANGINPESYYGSTPPTTQLHIVTNRNYTLSYQQLGGSNFVSYLLDTTDFSGSNRTVRAVFVSNTNPAISTKVYLSSYYPYAMDPDVVELSSVLTNTQGVTTNFLYIEDSFLYYTNFQLFLGGYAGVGYLRPTYMPANYDIFQSAQYQYFVGTPATPVTIPRGTFSVGGNGNVTNQWTAYQALFQPGSVVLADVPGQNVTNQPGRMELTADKCLTLPEAQISSGSYLLMKATNHFAGSSGAQIASPFADIYLRSTNGLLNLTNVLMPSMSLPNGVCDLFSARWTNVVDGITNRFHVFFVDVQLQPNSLLMVQTLNLSATNAVAHTDDDSIYLRDVFNVTSNLLINTRRLTVTTNASDSLAPNGILNYLNPGILWPASTPRLQYLTNYGVIRSPNFAVFGGSQTSAFSGPDSSSNAYAAFVNTGGVTNFGAAIFANYFQNSGTFYASGGALRLRQAQTVIMTNGAFLAPGAAGAIAIQGGGLLVSNHVLQAGAALTLSATDYLDDGSLGVGADAVTNKNTWYSGYGLNLPVLPTRSSLLATTISNTGPAGALVPNLWAGQDRGPVTAGYNNNAAIGRLILDGRDARTRFNFQRTGLTNALYVDLLELKDSTTNADNLGNFVGINLDTNFTVYYGDAIVAGHSIAEKLDRKFGYAGTNGGRFVWVSNYNTGFFSSTNVTYSDGSVHRLNRALVYSCNIDSNGQPYPPTGGANATCDGTVLKPDAIPVLTPASLVLTATFTNQPVRSIVLSWNTIPLSTNALYAAPSPLTSGTNWQLVTNFVTDETLGGRAAYTDPIKPNAPRYYRVQAQSP